MLMMALKLSAELKMKALNTKIENKLAENREFTEWAKGNFKKNQHPNPA